MICIKYQLREQMVEGRNANLTSCSGDSMMFRGMYTSSSTPYRIPRACAASTLTYRFRFLFPFESKTSSNRRLIPRVHAPYTRYKLHHFPLTRSSSFYAVVRSTPDASPSAMSYAITKKSSSKCFTLMMKKK